MFVLAAYSYYFTATMMAIGGLANSGHALVLINEVTLCRARLVL